MKKIALLGLLALGITSCGGGNNATPAINVTGTWEATLDGSISAVYQLTLNQSGNNVSGDAEIATYAGTFTNIYDPFGKVTGTVSGDHFTLNTRGTGGYSGSLTLSGTVVAGKLTGNWKAVGASGQSANGSFSAIKIE